MKNLKKVFALAMSVVTVIAMTLVPKVYANAEESDVTTWYVTFSGTRYYVSNNKRNWWTEGLNAVDSEMKDGDHIIVNGDNACGDIAVEITVTKKVGDLCVTNGGNGIVYAPYAENVYVAGSGVLVAHVDTANKVDIYPEQTLQIIGNVNTFEAHYDSQRTAPKFGVSGTVKKGTLKYRNDSSESYFGTIYDIAAGKCKGDANGIALIEKGQYSSTPSTTPAAKPGNNGKKELDSVPNTGAREISESFIFFALAAAFALGAVICKKKIQ